MFNLTQALKLIWQFTALLKPGDVDFGYGNDAGGHLTHGAKVNFSGKEYKSYEYGFKMWNQKNLILIKFVKLLWS